MSKDYRFQTRSFPSRVPKGTRRFLMRRPAVYYSKDGIYPDVRLNSPTRIIILITNTIVQQNTNPTRKYSGVGIKQNNHNILWTRKMQNPLGGCSKNQKQILRHTHQQNPLEKMLGGWMSKLKSQQLCFIHPTRMCSGAGNLNKHHKSTYNPTRICSGAPNLQHQIGRASCRERVLRLV